MATDFEETIREAARRADRAVNRAMTKYGRGLVTDEDDLTGILVGQLDAELEGQIGGLTWSTSIVRHRKGTAAEEKATGADMVFHVSFRTRQRSYRKGILVQAKRVQPETAMSAAAHKELVAQCEMMLKVTPAAFVFDYAPGAMRCGLAIRIAGSKSRVLYEECSWTSYRFFLELFRYQICDPRLTSALVRDLPVPTVLEITASGD